MTEYPTAGTVVDGRLVRDKVPNTESIDASLEDYTILPRIREVPLSDFNSDPRDMFYAADDIRHSEKLAEEIAESGEISPLIVVIDDEGPYILEGAHRLAALHVLGAKTFPALVVVDDEVTENPSVSKPKLDVSQNELRSVLRDYDRYGGAKIAEIVNSVAPEIDLGGGGAYPELLYFEQHYDLPDLERRLREIAVEDADGLWRLKEWTTNLKAKLLR